MPFLSTRWRVVILVALAVIAYLPALTLPFIVDDYHQIALARDFAAQGWTPLFHNLELRSRATYMLMSALLDRVFGFTPVAFYAAGILLHVCCVLLVYASGTWTEIGGATAFWAAAFFAIQEGHQEAIMWPAAAGDLLVFLFGMAAWVCWVRWLQGGQWKCYAIAILSFLLAVPSKESVWIFAALMLIPVASERKLLKRGLAGATPFLAIALAYVLWIWMNRVSGMGHQDARFSLSAPWLHILLNSWWKLLFPWGLLAIAILLWLGRPSDRRRAAAAMIWMLLALVPFCFLTYMLQLPSRLTYLASAGLAWLFGTAIARLVERGRYSVTALLCLVTLAINVEILWVKKMSQFRERAEPSELLKKAAAGADGTVSVGCVPLPDFVTVAVLKSVGTTVVFQHPDAPHSDSCYSVDYRDHQGHLVHEARKLGAARHGTFY